MLGEFKVENNSVEVTEWGHNTYARMVFIWLVTHGKKASRAIITDALWPDTAFSTADAHLSKAVSQLRKLLGSDAIKTTGHRSGYEIVGDVWVDLDECRALLLEAEKIGRFTEKAVEYLEQAARLLDRGACLESESWSWCHAVRASFEEVARCTRLWLAQAYESRGLYWNAKVQKRHLDLEEEDQDMNRRQLLQSVTSIPLMPVGSVLDCSFGIETCWSLLYEGRIDQVLTLLPIYQTYTTSLAQQVIPARKFAAGLASHVYQMAAEIASQKFDILKSRHTLDMAMIYAEQAGEPNILVAVSIRKADSFFHAQDYKRAAHEYETVLPLARQSTPLLHGRVYVGLAEVYSFLGRREDALRCIQLAHQYYPPDPETDPAYSYTHYNKYELFVFGDGQSHLSLGDAKAAMKVFEKVEEEGIGDPNDPLMHVDLEYYKSLALTRLGVMDIDQLISAALYAQQAGSTLYLNKNKATLLEMKKRWPNELKLKKLELPTAQA